MAKYEVVTTVTTIEGEKPRVGHFENNLSEFCDRANVKQQENVKIQLRTFMSHMEEELSVRLVVSLWDLRRCCGGFVVYDFRTVRFQVMFKLDET